MLLNTVIPSGNANGARRHLPLWRWLVIVPTLGLPQVQASETQLHQGERIFRDQCSGCHSLEPGEHRAGPSLAGLIGRPAASLDDYTYSQALEKADHDWSAETLDRFLADPQAFVPGTAMVFWGLDDTTRERVIRYLEHVAAP